MKREEELAIKAKNQMDDASHESIVEEIYNEYLDDINKNDLDEDVFVDYLRDLYSFCCYSQSPEQTTKNTKAALKLLEKKNNAALDY